MTDRNRTNRTMSGNVLSVCPGALQTGAGQTGHTPLGVSKCPVLSGTPITWKMRESHQRGNLGPSWESRKAGSAERDIGRFTGKLNPVCAVQQK